MASHLLWLAEFLSLHYGAGLWSFGTQVLVRIHHHNGRGCHQGGMWVLLKAYQITSIILGRRPGVLCPFSGESH